LKIDPQSIDPKISLIKFRINAIRITASLYLNVILFINFLFYFCIFFSSNCALNESLIAELRKKLTSTENNLTDIRLEALSSVHQVDQLKEYLEKLKIDMMSLKSENQLLKKHIRETKVQKVNLAKNKVVSEFETNESFLDYLSHNSDDASSSSSSSSSSNPDESLDSVTGNLNTNYFYSYSKFFFKKKLFHLIFTSIQNFQQQKIEAIELCLARAL
jgi:hypothetical protein